MLMKTQRIQLTGLGTVLPDQIDLLILSSSFESRCESVALNTDPKRVRRVLVARNRNHLDVHSDHTRALLARFGDCAGIMELDSSDPLKTADSIARSVRQHLQSGSANIVVDISTFTREGFLILFRFLDLFAKPRALWYVYSLAAEYAVGLASAEKWLSRGITEVRSVLGYPGEFDASKRLHLVVLVGFEYDRVAELIRRCEPTVVSLGQAASVAQDDANHFEVHARNYARLRSVFGDVKQFEFPCYDPGGTRNAVLQQVRAHSGFNCIVSPMNTKLSTLGVARAAIVESSIQLVYAQPILYNIHGYSRPGDICYVINEDVEDLKG